MAESNPRPRVLVVDDDEVFRSRLCRALAQRNSEAYAAGNGDEAVALISRQCPDLALVDLRMPGIDGLDLIEPGVVQPHRWRPEPGDMWSGQEVTAWSGVARKS